MKLLFLTFSPLSIPSGHLARLVQELKNLSEINEVSIVCMRKGIDTEKTKAIYPKVHFYSIDMQFEGWEIKNLKEVVANVLDLVQTIKPDLVIQQMEVWELLRELSRALKDKVAFVAGLHAMPFLAVPLQQSGDFEKDVEDYLQTDVEPYKKQYIQDHYQEAQEVFDSTAFLAQYKTVEFFIKTYFPKTKLYTLTPSLVASISDKKDNQEFDYDFVYMARMEKGKGVEYLSSILNLISQKLGRKIKIAIMGKCDDPFSKEVLNKLLEESKSSSAFEIEYTGWAGPEKKAEILSKGKVFLYPSHYDTLATVVHEAIAFGLPVIMWDVLFYRLNYSGSKAIHNAPMLDFDLYTDRAVEALNNRDVFSLEAKKFAMNFPTPKEIAKLDTELFKRISRDYGKTEPYNR